MLQMRVYFRCDSGLIQSCPACDEHSEMTADPVGDPDAVTMDVAVGALLLVVVALQCVFEANTPAKIAAMMAATSARSRQNVEIRIPGRRLVRGLSLRPCIVYTGVFFSYSR